MEIWQSLLLHLFKDGQVWKKSLERDDWRKRIERNTDLIEPLSLTIINETFQIQNRVKRESTPSDSSIEGFVLRPGKHNHGDLVILVPFILEPEEPRLSLQLGFFLEKGLNFFGFRFESPEKFESGAGTEHQFYHAQPIQGFGHGKKNPNSVPWYPERYPSFPLFADDEFELITSILISIWQWEMISNLALTLEIKHEIKFKLRDYLERIQNTD